MKGEIRMIGKSLFLGLLVAVGVLATPTAGAAFIGDSSATFTGLTEFGANEAHVTGRVTVDAADCETATPEGELYEWEDGEPCGGRVVVSAGQTCDYAGEVLWESAAKVLSNESVSVDAMVDLPEWSGCVFLGYYAYTSPGEIEEIADPGCLPGFAPSVRWDLCRREGVEIGDYTREMLLAQWGGVQADCRRAKRAQRRSVQQLHASRRRRQSRPELRRQRRTLRRAALRTRRAC